ncbi:branched-chain amino acid ABC transporter substrate-binding protein [Rhizobium helianthi]|uniref:Branched-chain amino acid ABC transporter substrate-binding protein n=1 Tax=Rhizobium helianthi TaxID=1132695 RepID=A0ABW4LYL2_9HYPH
MRARPNASFHILGITAFSLLLTAKLAGAATIGIVAPQTGPYASLGEQIIRGASAALGVQDRAVTIHETCEPGSGKAIAEQLRNEGIEIAIGFLCVETLADVLPELKDSQIPAMTVAVRSRLLAEDAQRNGWPFFRLAPADGQEAAAMADAVLTHWQNQSVALVDDGTIYARDLISAVRQKLEAGGIKPVFVDTFRPGQEQQLALVRRLAKAGATRVVVGGDRSDVAIMARDAQKEGSSLVFMGGDVMRAANRPVPLSDGVLAVALPDYAKLPDADDAVSIMQIADFVPEGYALPAYAAVQTVIAAAEKAKGEDKRLESALHGTSFNTAIGTISFQQNGELADNPFRLQEWRHGGWLPFDQVTE